MPHSDKDGADNLPAASQQQGDPDRQQPPEGALAQLLEQLPPEQREIVLALSASSYSGPVPSPKMLKEYENVLPGTADRLIKMAEKEQSMREQENKKLLQNASPSV